jgi:hypothetical protein
MTFEDIRQPGAPLVICTFEPQEIGFLGKYVAGMGKVDDEHIPHTILRQVTLEDFLATLRPEYREGVRADAEPDVLFYEVSVD